MPTNRWAILLLPVAAMVCSVCGDPGQFVTYVASATSRQMVDSSGSVRDLPVPDRARLLQLGATSGGNLTLAFAKPPKFGLAENAWCEVFFSRSLPNGKPGRELRLAVLVSLSGAPDDDRLAKLVKPGYAYIWRDGVPGLETVETKVEEGSVIIELGDAALKGLGVREIFCHWYPRLGTEWSEPRAWETAIGSYVARPVSKATVRVSIAGLLGPGN